MTQRQAVKAEPCADLTVREQLNQVALERDLRPSTRIAYQRCMAQLGILDERVSKVTRDLVIERSFALSHNTRRGALIAARSVLGYKLPIPTAIPRRYQLPTEEELRFALLFTEHETRSLCMMYCGVRLSEAAALTRTDVRGDRLQVTKQIQTLRETGKPTVTRVAPVKSREADVIIPGWLADRVKELTETVKPDPVRESLRRAGKKAGLPIVLNPHMLRAWCITTMIERGVPLALVQKQARHSTIQLTLTHYQEYRDGVIHDIFG